jgi:hypothetical protein
MAAVSRCVNASTAGIFLREVAAVPEVEVPTVVTTSFSARCGLQYSKMGPGLVDRETGLTIHSLACLPTLVSLVPGAPSSLHAVRSLPSRFANRCQENGRDIIIDPEDHFDGYC